MKYHKIPSELFSKNRKAIKWKTVFIGLTAQLLLAIGVLKVDFIQKIFEFFGRFWWFWAFWDVFARF